MQAYRIKKNDPCLDLLLDFYKVSPKEKRLHIKYAMVKNGKLYKTDGNCMLVVYDMEELQSGFYEIVKNKGELMLIEVEEQGSFPAVEMIEEKDYSKSYAAVANIGDILSRSALFARIVRAMEKGAISFEYLTKAVSQEYSSFGVTEKEPYNNPIKIRFGYAALYIMPIKVVGE
jgi:hypothetical protein